MLPEVEVPTSTLIMYKMLKYVLFQSQAYIAKAGGLAVLL